MVEENKGDKVYCTTEKHTEGRKQVVWLTKTGKTVQQRKIKKKKQVTMTENGSVKEHKGTEGQSKERNVLWCMVGIKEKVNEKWWVTRQAKYVSNKLRHIWITSVAVSNKY
jgi:hypothetical protein